MTRLLSIATLLGLSTIMVAGGDASAKGTKGGPGGGMATSGSKGTPKSGFSNYKQTHGEHFRYGTFYRGYDHRHWTSWCWNSRYGCYFYWCPSACCYYYWYSPSCCYYPVTCLSEFRPTPVTYQTPSPGVAPLPVQTNTQVTVPIQVTNTNQNTLASGGPIVPPTPVGIAPPGFKAP